MEKEYGKLTADQFKEFIGKLPELNRQRSEFGQLLSDLPKDKFDKLMVSGFSWAEIYEERCTSITRTLRFNRACWSMTS